TELLDKFLGCNMPARAPPAPAPPTPPPAGGPPYLCTPPRASLFGVRSMSLVLPDFGTLLFLFLLFILFSLSCLVVRCNHLGFCITTIRAKVRSRVESEKTAAI